MTTTPEPQDPEANFRELCAAWWDAAEYIARKQATTPTTAA